MLKLSPKSYKFKELLSLHHYPILIFFFFFYKFNYSCNCSAGFSVPFNEDREQDLVSRTSESHDFLRNYKKHRMIRTCAFSCMRRNGRTHRKMTVGLFQKLAGAGVARSMNQKAQPADISSRCYLFQKKTSKMLLSISHI